MAALSVQYAKGGIENGVFSSAKRRSAVPRRHEFALTPPRITDLLNRIGFCCGGSFVDEHIHHGLLKGSGQIGKYLRGLHIDAFGTQFLGEVEDGGL